MSKYVVEKILGNYEFFMDVSPSWWINHRSSDKKIKKYVSRKFLSDFYPRIVFLKGKKIDMDKPKDPFREAIFSKIVRGYFLVEFLPEEEQNKIRYEIKNGKVSIHQQKEKENAKLRIHVKEYSGRVNF